MLCEGVMGLFDGTGPDGEAGSTAELAALTGWPVVLVVDARGQGASAAALVAGFARHDPAVPLAGVLFNRVAGPRHRDLLTAALARHLPALPCLGALPRDPELALPERHLGLVPAGERSIAAEAAIARAAAAVAAHVDVDRLLALARPARAAERLGRMPAVGGPTLAPLGQRIAVARDDAFLLRLSRLAGGLARSGAPSLSFFSPLADEPPDPAADAVYLPGGYPELHAGRLAAANASSPGCAGRGRRASAVLRRMRRLHGAGRGVDRCRRPGPPHGRACCRSSPASPSAGCISAIATRPLLHDGPLGPAGSRFRGHEFHYATTLKVAGEAPLFALTDASGNDLGAAGLQRGSASARSST